MFAAIQSFLRAEDLIMFDTNKFEAIEIWVTKKVIEIVLMIKDISSSTPS